MQVSECKYEDGWLMLKTDEAQPFVSGFAPRDYDITPHREKRSKTANSYAWVLLQKIAAKQRISPLDAYIHEIRDMGGITDTVWIRASAFSDFKRSFIADHIGRFVDLIGVDNNGYAEVLVTYGSSDFDRAQMAQLIDNICAECEILGIETKPPEYVASLLEAYEW